MWFESFSGLTTTGATVMTGLISSRLPFVLPTTTPMARRHGYNCARCSYSANARRGVCSSTVLGPGPVKDSKLTSNQTTALAPLVDLRHPDSCLLHGISSGRNVPL